MQIKPLKASLERYLQDHQLVNKFAKQTKLFEQNPGHPSLNTELLEPKSVGIHSFRLDRKYRVLFIIVVSVAEVVDITDHYQ